MLPTSPPRAGCVRFGAFELDAVAGELRRDGRRLKLQPQPFRLLALLASQPGRLVTRDEIRRELWSDGTFVDFDQAVNFAIRQVREALGDSAETPLYVETVPKRGYRFIAPVQPAADRPVDRRATSIRLQKALWANIAELRLGEQRRRRRMQTALLAMAAVMILLTVLMLLRR